MEKSLILFLNLVLVTFCSCQISPQKFTKCDCSDKKIQDSLIAEYLDKAEALPDMYNNPLWLDYCDSLIAICPNIAFAYQHKAVPYLKNGEYEKAFALIDKAVELDPQRWTSYRGFCKCIFTKDYEGAIIDFHKAQQIFSGGYEMDHSYFFWQAVSYLELKNYSEAEKNFKQDIFIETNGDTTKNTHFNSLFYFGVLYFEMKRYNLAKKYLLKCLLQYKQHPIANYYLAMVYKAEKNYALEKKYLQIAKQAFEQDYGLNEYNDHYTNYPYQIHLYEVEQAITNIK
jgi:tetratricopeptide (TPR) repeat protein